MSRHTSDMWGGWGGRQGNFAMSPTQEILRGTYLNLLFIRVFYKFYHSEGCAEFVFYCKGVRGQKRFGITDVRYFITIVLNTSVILIISALVEKFLVR